MVPMLQRRNRLLPLQRLCAGTLERGYEGNMAAEAAPVQDAAFIFVCSLYLLFSGGIVTVRQLPPVIMLGMMLSRMIQMFEFSLTR